MAGTLPGFNADEVRAGLHLAMEVGLPPNPADQPLFHFPATSTADADSDGQGTPLDWAGSRAGTAPTTPAAVPCAIEAIDDQGNITAFGTVSSNRLVLTFLDVDYEKIEGFDFVLIGGNQYFYQRTLTPMGLVDLGVWQVVVRTTDEA